MTAKEKEKLKDYSSYLQKYGNKNGNSKLVEIGIYIEKIIREEKENEN